MKRIITLAKKECFNCFSNPTGYIFAGLALVLSSWIFFVGFFIEGQVNLDSYWTNFIWIMSLFIPAISMNLIAEEKKNGTWELLLSIPVKERDLVLGKFWGAGLYLLLVAMLSVPVIATVFIFGNPGLGMAVSGFLGIILLMLSYLSLGLFLSSITTQPIIAFLGSTVILLINNMMGKDFLLSRVPAFWGNILSGLSLSSRSINFFSGLVQLSDVVFFISWMVILVMLAKKAFKSVREINLIIIVILVNIVLSLFSSPKIDLTPNKIHSLSPVSEQIAKNVDDIVNIKVFVSSELPSDIKPIRASLKLLLTEYQKINKNIKVSFLDPNNNEAIKSEAEKLGIDQIQFSTVKSNKYEVSNGYFGLAVVYGGKNDVLPVINDVQNFEYYIDSAIKRLTDKKIPKVALFENSEVDNDLVYLGKYLENSYKVQYIDLNDSNHQLDNDVETLIVVGNENKLSNEALLKIRNLLADNKSVLVFMDRIGVESNMTGRILPETGMEQILRENGMEIENKLILDNSAAVANFQTDAGEFKVQYPYWVKILPENFNKNIPAIAQMSSVTFPWVSDIKTGDGVIALIKSSNDSFANEDLSNLVPINQTIPSGYKLEPLVVAAAKNSDKGRIGLVADSDFVKDSYFVQSQQNLVLALNLVDYFSQDGSMASIRSKTINSNPIKTVDDRVKLMAQYGNVVLPVVLLALVYVVFNLIRKKKNEGFGKK